MSAPPSTTAMPWGACLLHAWNGPGPCPSCSTAVIGPLSPPMFQSVPSPWKQCPHCLGSGVVQADDDRPTTSPLDAGVPATP